MATIIMINRNSSVIIKNHEKKGNKKGSAMDGDNSEDDEETDNNRGKNADWNNEPSKDSNALKQEACERKDSNAGGISVNCNANDTIYLDNITRTDTAKENCISSTNHAVASMITQGLNMRQAGVPDIVQKTVNPNIIKSEKDVKNIPRVRRKLPNIDSQYNSVRKRFNNSLSTLESGEDSEDWTNEAFEIRASSSPNSSATSTLSSTGNILSNCITYLSSLHEEAGIVTEDVTSSQSPPPSSLSASASSSPQSEKSKLGQDIYLKPKNISKQQINKPNRYLRSKTDGIEISVKPQWSALNQSNILSQMTSRSTEKSY